MRKLGALKKLRRMAEENEEQVAENVDERTSTVDEEQVENVVETATDAVGSNAE